MKQALLPCSATTSANWYTLLLRTIRPESLNGSSIIIPVPHSLLWILLIGLWIASFATTTPILIAADLSEAEKLIWQGDYQGCITLCEAEVTRGVWNENWSRLLIECQLQTGKYQQALTTYETALERYANSLRLRLLGIEVYNFNNLPAKARSERLIIPELLDQAPWRYTSRDQLVPLGKYFLMEGEDARKVLESCFDRALKADPDMVEAHLASAQLALDKDDAPEALKSLDKALKLQPDNPDVHFLVARCWSSSDPEREAQSIQNALKLNASHIPSLTLQTEKLIQRERYAEAQEVIDRILAVNPHHPIAWAMRAAIHHLQGKYKDEGEARRNALEKWGLNPQVDFTIGRLLSQHYLFAEGVEYLRRSVSMQPDFLPAQAQLAQDLLRLGQTEEGWTLVEKVRTVDQYNVVAFNLRQLREQLEKFTTLEQPGFVVRMDAKEAELYGSEVLSLLSEAREQLTAKYEVQLEEPIYVEIFPQQRDFAIRTFGLPGGQGFLGVCFGRLITANSPASQGENPSNWKSVLWHEYCHVVTLQKSKNRMPRWLSEGISVYEEGEKNRSWREPLNPDYRERLLADDLRPISRLSSAFLEAASAEDVQFAYFQSAIAIDFLVEKFGIATLKKVLSDMGAGLPVNEALSRYTGSLEVLDGEFLSYAKDRASNWNPEAQYQKLEEEPPTSIAQWQTLLAKYPNHIPTLNAVARSLVAEKQWDLVAPLLERLQKLTPDDASESGVYGMLAAKAKSEGNLDAEKQWLLELTSRNADSITARVRLAELAKSLKQWELLDAVGSELLAVQPLLPQVHEIRVEANEQLGRPAGTTQPLIALLQLDPTDPAAVHFRLAKSYAAVGDQQLAKRHVLMALEDAPRYRSAQQLLLKLVASESRVAAPDVDAQPPSPTDPPSTTPTSPSGNGDQ